MNNFTWNKTPFFPDLKECSQIVNPCPQHANCIEMEGSFTCSCADGFTGNGTYCEGWYLCH